jgi:adenine-specific DNA-methyltransferase
MVRKRRAKDAESEVVDYRHRNASRLNIPPAGLAARGQIVREKTVQYAYNPHLAPTLRFDGTGRADRIAALLDEAGKRPLTAEEIKLLEGALRNHEPWLEWAGKREQPYCVADPVALHLHERVSTQAILRVVRREDVQRDLFADPEQEYREAVQFYRHPMDWTNRMILGDSLAVMASLARREALAGKVQMIYMDPPYGIKYASNFQPEVGRRDVKERDEDLTREPEMVKAYRDTWTLGVHSYLSYLRDRLLLCRELLADTGSVFVQIGEENQHTVRCLLDEVFGQTSFCGLIPFVTTGGQSAKLLGNIFNFLLWYVKDVGRVKFRQLYTGKSLREGGGWAHSRAELPDGTRLSLGVEGIRQRLISGEQIRPYSQDGLTSQGATVTGSYPFAFQEREYGCTANSHWKTDTQGMVRLARASRIEASENSLRYTRFLDDFPVQPVVNLWDDTNRPGYIDEKRYAVQTSGKVIERCLLMTTDPGDLVLDPTCGSGTTAYVAEQWGRRWITLDVSRVALAIARQRLLTAKFDFYQLRPTSAEDVQRNPSGPWLSDPAKEIPGTCTFDCKTVPHVTLKSIAQNQALDPIFDRWEPILAEKLTALNAALARTGTKELRQKLLRKLQAKQQAEGKRAISDRDERRWRLPEQGWNEWEVPFDADPEWPAELKETLGAYRQNWRQKMEEVNACIAARADQEELVDQPVVDRTKVRVSGPFTMEGIIPAEESIQEEEAETPITGAPEVLDTFGGEGESIQTEAQNTEAYLDRMVRLLREDGVRFPDNKAVKFASLEALADGSTLHGQGSWGEGSEERKVAVMFGPQYGPLIAAMVEDGIRLASQRGYHDLVFAGFSFDGAAQAAIQADPDRRVRIHMAQIRPDVNMGDLLKTTVSSQIFTVSGMPRTELRQTEEGQYVVEMQGVDIYDPVTNTVRSTGAGKVAAWFLDADYDGRCFCISQAFFPDKSAWEKLRKALHGVLEEEAFEKLSGTVSLPFPGGPHQRVAVKVIDPRGNEVLRVHRLGDRYA